MTIGLLLFFGILTAWLLIRDSILLRDLRFLERQLGEIERGSQMELGVLSRQKELLALCRRLNGLHHHWRQERIRYERGERQLKQNITSLAHDIRTPLTGAAGYIQLAQECKEAEQQSRYLGIAEGRLKELGDMLEELFLYTKLTSEEFELTIQDLQALPLLSDCLIGLYHRFEAAGLSPEVEFEEEGIRVRADEEALRRVFHNLIQNALVHGAGGIVIRQKQVASSSDLFSAVTEKVVRPEVSQLESEADRSMVCLVFENRISPGDKPDPARLFERFYKADSARHRGSSGLGLFIVKELVERMGGGVSARLKGDRLQIAVYLQESLA